MEIEKYYENLTNMLRIGERQKTNSLETEDFRLVILKFIVYVICFRIEINLVKFTSFTCFHLLICTHASDTHEYLMI